MKNRLLAVKNLQDRFLICAHPIVTALGGDRYKCTKCDQVLSKAQVKQQGSKIENNRVSLLSASYLDRPASPDAVHCTEAV